MNLPAEPYEVEWRKRFIGTVILIVAGLTLAWFLAPGTLQVATGSKLIVCPFRNLTGLPCPGCGMTRAFHHLVHLRFAEAASSNILAFWLMGCTLVELVNSIVGAVRRGRPLFYWTPQFEKVPGRILSYLFVATAFVYDGVRITMIIRAADAPIDVFTDALLYKLFIA